MENTEMKLQYECMHTNNHPTKMSFDLILPEIFLTTAKKLNKLTTKVRNDFPEYHNLIDVDTYRLNNKFYYFIYFFFRLKNIFPFISSIAFMTFVTASFCASLGFSTKIGSPKVRSTCLKKVRAFRI